MRTFSARNFGLAIVSLWTLAGCGAGAKIDVGGTCFLNSDCNGDLVCSGGKCHDACHKSTDCPAGQTCITGSNQATVCQLTAETNCVYASDCQAPLVCAADQRCRNQCQTDRDCATSTQKCVLPAGVCAEAGAVIGPSQPTSGLDAGAQLSGPDASVPPDASSTPPSPDAAVAQTDAPTAASIESLVPGANGVSGWLIDPSDTTTSSGPAIARSEDEATALIDGAAAFFYSPDYSPTALALQNYVRGSYSLELELWQLASPANASRLYTDFLLSPLYANNTWATAAVGDAARIGNTGTSWWVNVLDRQYFISISLGTSFPEDTTGRAQAIAFAQAVVARIDAGGPLPAQVDAGRPDVAATVLGVSPATLNFGQIDVGSVSSPLVATVTNTGTLVLVNPTVTGVGFAIDSTTCGNSPVASCTISVVFAPLHTGAAAGVLTVAPGILVSLSGAGTLNASASFAATSSPIPPTALVNQVVPISVTVTAQGPLSDLTCMPSGSDLTPDPLTTTCIGTLAADASCIYGFTFESAASGLKSDSVVCSAAGVTRTLPVTPTVVSPASLAITPTSAAFTANVGATSASVVFNVGNSGNATSGTLTAALTGANATEFTITDNKCILPLVALTTCSIQVAFKPIAAGAKTASLNVTTGATAITAALTGTATGGPALTIAGPASLGSVTVGQAGPAATFTVANTGGGTTGSLSLSAGDSDFVVKNDLCSGLTLAATKTCTFTVSFRPTAVGAESTLLSVSASGTLTASLPITGTGVPSASLAITPASLDFGAISVATVSAPLTFTVTNTGGTATNALVVTKTDGGFSIGGGAQFTDTTTCTAALAPAATCQVVVRFAPVIVGSVSATITVEDGTGISVTGGAVGISRN